MTAPRWANQDTYADLIEPIAATNGVPASLAYGLIAQESNFIPTAVRNEPTYNCHGVIGDSSYGLTQVLSCTARDLGYTGTVFGLFDPATNLSLGLLLLGRLLVSHGGDVGAALSAYNGGDRHALGYGARRGDGTFANQAYVNNVLANADYFDTYLTERDGADQTATPDPTAVDTSGGASPPSIVGILAVAAGAYAIAQLLRS